MRLEKLAWRFVLITACTPLVLLAGCPQDNPDTPKISAQSTAPALPTSQPDAIGESQSTPTSTSLVKSQQLTARAQQLISQAETIYTSGVHNYRAGHVDAARQDFDLAVDTMLASGLDLRSDPQLADEFEHLLNAVNALEMDALKQGNGLSPTLEAAPLEGADNEVTFPANPELTAKITAE